MRARFNSPTITRTICVRRSLFTLTSFERILLRAQQPLTQRIHKVAHRKGRTKSAKTLLIHRVEILHNQLSSTGDNAHRPVPFSVGTVASKGCFRSFLIRSLRYLNGRTLLHFQLRRDIWTWPKATESLSQNLISG